MEIILRADVDNLGRLGETVRVKPGYARNYLIPQGLAMPASAGNLKLFEQERKKLQVKMDAFKTEAESLAAKLEAAPVTIEVRVGEAGKLYGSVTSANIADALNEAGVEIDRKKILLDEAIRALGVYEVEVKLHPDVRGAAKVSVVRQGGPLEEDIAEEEAASEDAVAAQAEEAPADSEVSEDTAEEAAQDSEQSEEQAQ